jgi:3-methyladenine DNA glycosylase AlkD
MKTSRAVIELQEAMEFYRDPEKAEQMVRYMKGKFMYLGINQPIRKELSKPFIQAAKKLDMAYILQYGAELWKLPEREYQYVAMELLYAGRKKWDPAAEKFFLSLVTDKSWWDTVDFIAAKLIGGCWQHKTDWSIMKKWVASDNIWKNRTALLFQLFYKEKTDPDFLFWAINELKSKKEFFIQKAIGWSLRQYHRVAPGKVEAFVEAAGISGLAKREALKHAG